MKNFLFFIAILLTFVSCVEEKVIEVQPKGIENTIWLKSENVFFNDKEVFKIFIFEKDSVRHGYTIEKDRITNPAATMAYIYDAKEGKLWFEYPGFPVYQAKIIGNEFHINDEILILKP